MVDARQFIVVDYDAGTVTFDPQAEISPTADGHRITAPWADVIWEVGPGSTIPWGSGEHLDLNSLAAAHFAHTIQGGDATAVYDLADF